MPDVPDFAAAIVKGKLQSISVRLVEHLLQPRLVRSWGVKAEEGERKVAFVKCAGTCEKKQIRTMSTQEVRIVPLWHLFQMVDQKSCNYGCLGFGNCVKACPFDAIHVVDGVAVVDKEVCKACGKCVAACPKHLIELFYQ